jgi:hypothetical protein
MNPSLILVDKEGSEAASSPQLFPAAGEGSPLHLVCESKSDNNAVSGSAHYVRSTEARR